MELNCASDLTPSLRLKCYFGTISSGLKQARNNQKRPDVKGAPNSLFAIFGAREIDTDLISDHGYVAIISSIKEAKVV